MMPKMRRGNALHVIILRHRLVHLFHLLSSPVSKDSRASHMIQLCVSKKTSKQSTKRKYSKKKANEVFGMDHVKKIYEAALHKEIRRTLIVTSPQVHFESPQQKKVRLKREKKFKRKRFKECCEYETKSCFRLLVCEKQCIPKILAKRQQRLFTRFRGSNMKDNEKVKWLHNQHRDVSVAIPNIYRKFYSLVMERTELAIMSRKKQGT